MKLREANKEDNRKFHELPESERHQALEAWYSQVFSSSTNLRTDFTPFEVSLESLTNKPSREEIYALNATASKLNFLMSRYTMGKGSLGDVAVSESRVRELALLRFEYLLYTGAERYTQNPQLIADFFTKRGKPEFIRPVLARFGESAIEYQHLTEKIVDHPLFKEHLGSDAIEYKFRSRLHSLMKNQDYSKEQAAIGLLNEGYDLLKHDYNRWYRTEKDYSISSGEKEYQESPQERDWLFALIAEQLGQQTPLPLAISEDLSLIQIAEEDEPEHKYEFSKKGIEALDQEIQLRLSKEQLVLVAHWIKQLAALTSDHAEISFNSSNLVEAKIWDYLWGGRFSKLASQLKGDDSRGKIRRGLNYIKWALTHEEHQKGINPTLAQNAYAMIIAGDLLVGELEIAKENLNAPELQAYKNPNKIKAAINLAWEKLQHPSESDDPPPKAYLFEIAADFTEALRENSSAAPYIKLATGIHDSDLGKEEQEILAAITCFNTIEKVYTQLGMADRIKDRFLEIFDLVYDQDTEFMSNKGELIRVVLIIKNKTFRKYVDDQALGERLQAAVKRTLERKNEYLPDELALGSNKLVLTILQNSLLRPFLQEGLDIGALANNMIDDLIGGDEDLLKEPLSLRHTGEICWSSNEIIEVYMLADRLREQIDPQRMQRLVAYLLAVYSDMNGSSSFNLTSLVINVIGAQTDPNYQKPDYFPDLNLENNQQRIQFLTNIYEREKMLGGLDRNSAAIAVTNVIFKGTYVEANRFRPHLDAMLEFLNSPLAELLPSEGLGHDAVLEYKILNEFLKS